MKVCAKCQTENEDINNYCKKCGNPLVVKEEPVLEASGTEARKKNIQICPKCRVLHEKGEFCIKCKTKLVPNDPSEKKEEPTCVDLVENEEPLRRQGSPDQQEELNVSSLTREDLMMGFTTEDKEEPSPVKLPRPVKKLPDDEMSTIYHQGRTRTFLSPMPLVLAGMIILIALAVYLSTKRSAPSASPSKEPLASAPAASSVHSVPTPEQEQEQEIGKIRTLLEDIRQANLQENIDLFMSCYALDFDGREEKKESTLENWKTLDYVDLSFSFKNPTVSADTAHLEIEWQIKTTQDKGSQPQESRILIDASLKKEDGNWKIKEIKTSS